MWEPNGVLVLQINYWKYLVSKFEISLGLQYFFNHFGSDIDFVMLPIESILFRDWFILRDYFQHAFMSFNCTFVSLLFLCNRLLKVCI